MHTCEEYYVPLVRLAMNITGDKHKAEDLAHDAIERFLKNTNELEMPKTILFKTLRQEWVDELRRERVHREHNDSYMRLTKQDCELPLDVMECFDADVAEALDSLPERDRKLVILKHVFDYTYKELAAYMGCTDSTAYARVKRATTKIKPTLRKVAKRERIIT